MQLPVFKLVKTLKHIKRWKLKGSMVFGIKKQIEPFRIHQQIFLW